MNETIAEKSQLFKTIRPVLLILTAQRPNFRLGRSTIFEKNRQISYYCLIITEKIQNRPPMKIKSLYAI
ncbi:MAG: hypothetical protein MJK04_22885, partial [Psychrosphaera sp.]|nr:hypothetical protein [Psychrosphaera sp.]